MSEKKVLAKMPKSADPTKGLGAMLIGIHKPTEKDSPLPFGESGDEDRA